MALVALRQIALSSIISLLFLLASCGSDGNGSGNCTGSFCIDKDIGISVTPDFISFGAVAPFETECQELQVTHSGTEAYLELSSVALEANAGDFSLVLPDVMSAAPGESMVISVCYTPSDDIQDFDNLVIKHNALSPSRDDVIVPISALPQEGTLLVLPNPVNFGPTAGGTPAGKSAELINAGSDVLTITSLTWREDTSPDFSIGSIYNIDGMALQVPFDLEPEGRATVDFIYNPTGGDADQGVALITLSNTVLPVIEVGVTGSERGPEIVVSPGVVDLDYVEVGGHAEAELLIVNQGTIELTVTSIAPALGSNPGLSVLDLPDAFPIQLAVNEPLVLRVAFDPTEAFGSGTVNVGGVSIASNDADEPVVVTPVYARENSPSLLITPDGCVDFGFTAKNLTTERIVTLYNGGSAPLHVSDVSVTGDGFGLLPTPGFGVPGTVEPGTAVEFTVTFENNFGTGPPKQGTLNIDTNDPVNPAIKKCMIAHLAATAECKVAFAPPAVQYGIVPHGKSKTMDVKATNIGSGPCQIPGFEDPDRLRIVDCLSFGPFSFGCTPGEGPMSQTSQNFMALAVPPPMVLNPGESSTLKIQFTPPPDASIFGEEFDNYRGLLHMKMIDVANGTIVWAPTDAVPGASQVSPNLVAASGISDIAVIPQEVDFGVITVGCASLDTEVAVYNKGNAPLNVTDIYLDNSCNSEFQLVSTPPLPGVLVQGSPLKVEVRYVPQNLGIDNCTLVIESDDPNVPALTVPMHGEGTYDVEQTDVFIQLTGQDVDVLFVVDNSGSMSEEQNNIANNIDSMVAAAQAWNTNYQLAVTTTDIGGDGGRFLGSPRFVTPQTPNGLAVFANNVKNVGDNGSGTEEGLEAAYLALTLPNTYLALDAQGDPISCGNDAACTPGGCYGDPLDPSGSTKYCGGANWGFPRENAALEIVMISDEEDQSPAELTFYIDFFKNLKGFANEDLIHVHSIVGDTPGGCDSQYGAAESAPSYQQVALDTGGINASICASDYSSILDEIGEIAFGLKKQFFLTRLAQPNSISVKIDGVPCNQGWSYDIPSNSVIFDENSSCMPQPGQEIEVHYETLCIQP